MKETERLNALQWSLRARLGGKARWLLVWLCCLGVGSGARSAHARPEFPAIVLQTYKLKPGGVVEAAAKSCALCHAHSGPPALNLYGKDIKAALQQAHTKVLTPAILQSVESKDSDGDGFTNAQEIAADTLPGDAASKPAGPPPGRQPSPASAEAADGPFGLKTLLLPRHAQHPVIVHFPIALFVLSLFFDLLGYWRGQPALTSAAYYNLVAAAVTAMLAVVTGLIAWQVAFSGIALRSNPFLFYHLVLGVTTTVLICLLWWLRARQQGRIGKVYALLGALTFLIISLVGHLGSILSGVTSAG